MLEFITPQNVTVYIEDEEGKVLAESSTVGKRLKVKTTNNPCYIKVTSNTIGSYTLDVNAYTEK